jgi:hypothetical protein
MMSEAPVTREDLNVVLEEIRNLRALIEQGGAGGSAIAPRPLTALQLIERWAVPGETPALRLDNLRARCRDWGLRPVRGTRGETALYPLADVVHAESCGAGKTKRRRHAA